MNLPVALRERNSIAEPSFSDPAAGFHLRPSLCLLMIAGFWLVIYVAGMCMPALLDDADTQHAEVAREMIVRHDWATLYANGIRYMEKAPLMYWGVAGSLVLFGKSEWAVRLPVVLWMLALFYATYWVGRKIYDESAGLYSALIMATAFGPYIYTRFLIPDTLVGLWLLLGFFFFLETLEETPPSRLACWGLAVSCALNVLTKGLIGLVFPVAVIAFYLILTGNLRHILRLRLISSTAIFLLVAAPWHILAAMRNPDQGGVRGFLWLYFVNEHFLRYLNKRVPRDYDTVPLLIFWGLLVLWLLPWSAFLPQALKQVPLRWREVRSRLDPRQRANLLFALWIMVIVVFFSFSTRQEYYTIPAIPAMALLVGAWFSREAESPANSADRRAGRISSALLFALGSLGFVVSMLLLILSKPPSPGTDLSELLKRNPEVYTLSFGHFLDLTPQAMGAFRGPLLGAALALLLGTGLNWMLRRGGRPAAGNFALAVMMIGLLACVHSAFVTFSPILSSKQLAIAIEQHYRPGDVIVVDGEYESASSLNFYIGIPLRILHEPSSGLWYGSHFPDAPHVFETPASFASLWAGPARIFLWSDQETPKELEGEKFYVLARDGGKFIFTNQDLKR